ncbi:MAG: transposase [Gammaproteobacteria bacterium]|nr:transposase [Gammaproteobacteria bacterium]
MSSAHQISEKRKPTQFLTAKLKLRPSRRKAAILERARRGAEKAFWDFLEEVEEAASEIHLMEKKADRTKAIAALVHPRNLRKFNMASAVTDGLSRDLKASVSSFVESRAGDHEAQWPTPEPVHEQRYEEGVDALAAALTKEDEDAARAEIYRGGQAKKYRPFVLARSRECRLMRKKDNSQIVAALSVMASSDDKARKAQIAEGIDAATGEFVATKRSCNVILVPVEVSKWHKHKFLSGNAVLKSCEIKRDGDEWFMLAQFEMRCRDKIEPEGVIGIDRGIATLAAGAAVDMSGRVKALYTTEGNFAGATIQKHERRNRQHQKRKGVVRKGHKAAVQQILHELANDIVRHAKSGRYSVALEKLGGFKKTVVQRRRKGARKGGWRKSLKRMQLSELERILEYKLKLAGLSLAEVLAKGTSETCVACGHKDRKSRVSQSEFKCAQCAFEAHADIAAGVNIARRHVMKLQEKIKKGVKLDALHVDMAQTLGDGGSGPLAASAADGFVQARDSGRMANEAAACRRPYLLPDQKTTSKISKKRVLHVFSESADHEFANKRMGVVESSLRHREFGG